MYSQIPERAGKNMHTEVEHQNIATHQHRITLNTLKDSCAGNENTVFHKLPTDFENIIKSECDKNSVVIESEKLKWISVLIANMCNSHYFNEDAWKVKFDKFTELSPYFEVAYKLAKESFVIKENIYSP